MGEIKAVAFDLGGVLVNLDLSCLNAEELLLFNIGMGKAFTTDAALATYAREKMGDIFLKCYKLRSKAIDTLDMLKQEKMPISLWTNNFKELYFWLEEEGLLTYIPKENVINSFYVGYDKPDVRYYNFALRTLGSMPESVFFLDDSYANLIGARKCLIKAIEYHENDDLQKVVKERAFRK